jgi:uncharacterized protein
LRHVVIVLIGSLIIGSHASRAQVPAVDTHLEAATELLVIMNVQKQMAAGAEAMADILIQQNPMLGPYRDVLLKWAASFMTWDTFGPRLIALYEAALTESELRDITAFYKTPSGQKSLAALPELTRASAALGATVAKEHKEELEAMIKTRAAEIEKLTAKP